MHEAVDGLRRAAAWAPAPGANTIGWLVWHLTRVQDDHVADVAGREQVWTAHGWAERFGLPFDPATPATATRSRSPRRARGRRPARPATTRGARADPSTTSRRCTDEDLDRVVDERWDPPVTLGVRLVSVSTTTQHAGQAAYVRGCPSAESRSGDGQGLGEPVECGREPARRQVAEAEAEDTVRAHRTMSPGQTRVSRSSRPLVELRAPRRRRIGRRAAAGSTARRRRGVTISTVWCSDTHVRRFVERGPQPDRPRGEDRAQPGPASQRERVRRLWS